MIRRFLRSVRAKERVPIALVTTLGAALLLGISGLGAFASAATKHHGQTGRSGRPHARAAGGLSGLPAGDVVLVVHSGTIRAVLAIALDLKPEGALRFVIDPLSLTRIDRLESGWRVVAVNQR